MLPPSSEPNRRTINQNTFIHLDKATIQGQESAVSLLFWLRGGAVVPLRALTVNPGDVLQYREPLDSDVSINQTHTDHSSTLAHAKWRASGDHVHTNTHKTKRHKTQTQATNTRYKHTPQSETLHYFYCGALLMRGGDTMHCGKPGGVGNESQPLGEYWSSASTSSLILLWELLLRHRCSCFVSPSCPEAL